MAYDVADPKRLRRICTLMEDHGERLKYSAFLCDLSVAELAELESAVIEVMDFQEDSVIQIDLGPLYASPRSALSAAPGACPPAVPGSCDNRCERPGTASTPGVARMLVTGTFVLPAAPRPPRQAHARGVLARRCIVPGHRVRFRRA